VGAHEHRQKGELHARCAIVTVSDTRTPETDTSGGRIRELLLEAGHQVASTIIVEDDPGTIVATVRRHLADAALQAIFLNGGTGLAPRDTTFEAIQSLLEKEITGFGELFRMLSFQEIGSAAMLSRATAGIAMGKLVVSMPGSTAAVDLAMRKLVVPELGHVLHLLEAK
jgi:molybdopterin adenylyltransferase